MAEMGFGKTFSHKIQNSNQHFVWISQQSTEILVLGSFGYDSAVSRVFWLGRQQGFFNCAAPPAGPNSYLGRAGPAVSQLKYKSTLAWSKNISHDDETYLHT